MTKQALYEKIMTSIAKEVKKALDEKFNFENQEMVPFDNFNGYLSKDSYETIMDEMDKAEYEEKFYNYIQDNCGQYICDMMKDADLDPEDLSYVEIDDFFAAFPDQKEILDRQFRDANYKATDEEWTAFAKNDVEVKMSFISGLLLYKVNGKWNLKHYNSLYKLAQPFIEHASAYRVENIEGAVFIKAINDDHLDELEIYKLNDRAESIYYDENDSKFVPELLNKNLREPIAVQ